MVSSASGGRCGGVEWSVWGHASLGRGAGVEEGPMSIMKSIPQDQVARWCCQLTRHPGPPQMGQPVRSRGPESLKSHLGGSWEGTIGWRLGGGSEARLGRSPRQGSHGHQAREVTPLVQRPALSLHGAGGARLQLLLGQGTTWGSVVP